MPQIPHGPDNLTCPFLRKKMSMVCHTCPLWVQVRGADPQTGEATFDEWACSFTHMPMLLINAAQQSRQAGASADKVATEIRKFHTNMVRMNNLRIEMGPERPMMIEERNDPGTHR